MIRFLKKIVSSALALSLIVTLINPVVSYAIDKQFYSGNNILFYDPDFKECAPSTGGGSMNNKDYKGREILTTAQLDAIKENRAVYEEAAKEAGIPWQMVAVIHLRETGLKRVNPSNGQGIYQDYAKINGPYPPGEVDEAEFLRQTKWAAQFLKNKATRPELLQNGDEGQVKDAFFGYNGRAGVYKTQAEQLGFSDAYEGSPYVMNKMDAKRDPESNPNGWGQIKSDGGSLEYPANSDYGAFVVYASLAGLSMDCDLKGTVREKIVQIAEREYNLWESGQMKPGSDFTKYTYGTQGDWCAWFVSWVLKEAGDPVNSSSQPEWPMVSQFATLGPNEKGYKTHLNDGSYTPKPGDFAIYGSGMNHINIVVGMEGSSVITIGGNEGAGGNGNFTTSKVKRNVGYGNGAYMYVSID